MLCVALLCYAMLRFALLSCAVLWFVLLCYALLCFALYAVVCFRLHRSCLNHCSNCCCCCCCCCCRCCAAAAVAAVAAAAELLAEPASPREPRPTFLKARRRRGGRPRARPCFGDISSRGPALSRGERCKSHKVPRSSRSVADENTFEPMPFAAHLG